MRWMNVILVALSLLSASCTRKPERSLTDNLQRFLIGEWKGTIRAEKPCRMYLIAIELSRWFKATS